MITLAALRQKIEWHRAELTPNDAKRAARRDAYDAKYDRCSHGTHPADWCAEGLS